jgi:hypothetical protein
MPKTPGYIFPEMWKRHSTTKPGLWMADPELNTGRTVQIIKSILILIRRAG